MRVVVHDYSGHLFQVELSRELARRGHAVLHVHCPSYLTGKGALEPRPDDPAGFEAVGVELREPLRKYSLWKRPLQEWEYAKRLVDPVAQFAPDVVVSGNTPILSQALFQRACRRRGYPFIFWQQDIYTLPMKTLVQQRVVVAGRFLGSTLVALEAALLRRSAAVVTISEDFVPILREWRVPAERLFVIENWAPIGELPVRPRENAWAREHGLVGKRVLLYSGTLGLKHDPSLLVSLARHFRDVEDVRVVVVTGGYGAAYLRRAALEHELENLVLLDFQPYERLPEVLGAAEILLVILEPQASVFSVPSKVLTYLCAGRPVVASIPGENLAARLLQANRIGVVTPPADHAAFAAAVERLLDDPRAAADLARRARDYAEAAFDVGRVADRFEHVIAMARGSRLPVRAQLSRVRVAAAHGEDRARVAERK